MLDNLVNHFCPICGKNLNSSRGYYCADCNKSLDFTIVEDIIIWGLNTFWLSPLKAKFIVAVIVLIVAPSPSTKIGGAFYGAIIGALLAIGILAFMYKIRFRFFIWVLKNDYRMRCINGSNYFQQSNYPISRKIIMALSPREFEIYIADIFRNLDYEVTITPSTSDGGKDLILKKDGKTYYVECKQWDKDASIGRPVLQKLIGAAISDGVTNVIFVATCKYSKNAVEAAKENKVVNVELWGMKDIYKAIERGSRVPPFNAIEKDRP